MLRELCVVHAPRDIDDEQGSAFQLLHGSEAPEHGFFELPLPLGGMLRRGDEPEGKHPLRPHRFEPLRNERTVHRRVMHVPEVAEKCQGAELFLPEQPLPGLFFVLAGRELHLPGVGGLQGLIGKLLPLFRFGDACIVYEACSQLFDEIDFFFLQHGQIYF